MFTRRDLLAAGAASAVINNGICAASPKSNIPLDISQLRARFDGEVITPDAQNYDQARHVAIGNQRVASHPAAIAFCASASDIARTIAFARSANADLAVRAGGHDFAGMSICDGVLLDVTRLNSIDIDATAHVVRVGAGLRSGQLCSALQPYGLAPALGCDPHVGVTGLTLSGGLGWMLGKHGAACDNLLSARLVTADGKEIIASPKQNPELLWGLKGGGGNFGVVTELTLAVHPVRQVVKGVIVYAAPRPAEFLRFFRDYAAKAGPDIDYEFYIMPRPTPMAFLKLCYTGDPDRAETVLAPLRAYGPPLADGISAGIYSGGVDPTGEAARLFAPLPEQHSVDDTPGNSATGVSAAPLSDALFDAIEAHIAGAPHNWRFGGGYYVRGAAIVDNNASAWPRHEGQMSFFFSAGWHRPEQAASAMAWVDNARSSLREHLGPTYINFITEQDQRIVAEAYGANYPRLRRLKRLWDPDNVFRRNRNIEPA